MQLYILTDSRGNRLRAGLGVFWECEYFIVLVMLQWVLFLNSSAHDIRYETAVWTILAPSWLLCVWRLLTSRRYCSTKH